MRHLTIVGPDDTTPTAPAGAARRPERREHVILVDGLCPSERQQLYDPGAY